MDQELTKRCYKCKVVKPICKFHKDKSKPDGYMRLCILCKREYRISPFYKQREKELEKTRQYKQRQDRYLRTGRGIFNRSKRDHIERSPIPPDLHDLTYGDWVNILGNQKNVCAICGSKKILEPDCIIPLSNGGQFSIDNVQGVCSRCNSKKGIKSYAGLVGNRWRKDFRMRL